MCLHTDPTRKVKLDWENYFIYLFFSKKKINKIIFSIKFYFPKRTWSFRLRIVERKCANMLHKSNDFAMYSHIITSCASTPTRWIPLGPARTSQCDLLWNYIGNRAGTEANMRNTNPLVACVLAWKTNDFQHQADGDPTRMLGWDQDRTRAILYRARFPMEYAVSAIISNVSAPCWSHVFIVLVYRYIERPRSIIDDC